MAAGAEELAEDGFGAAALAIDVGGVEQGDAGVERGVHDGAAFFEADAAAEIVAAEADGGDLEAGAAEVAEFHLVSNAGGYAGGMMRLDTGWSNRAAC